MTKGKLVALVLWLGVLIASVIGALITGWENPVMIFVVTGLILTVGIVILYGFMNLVIWISQNWNEKL